MDLVFMLPSSSSVGSSGWTDMIEFVSAIVGALNIDDGLARVGLLKFVYGRHYLNSTRRFRSEASY